MQTRLKTLTRLSCELEALIEHSRQYQSSLYPPESIHQDETESLINGTVHFIGAYQAHHLCAIGGVKIITDVAQYGEIKNLFVDPKYRRQGISQMIMHALEHFLMAENIHLCRLETGVRQPESIALYEQLGYQYRDPFGPYQPDPLSLFMEKTLTKP